MADHKRPRSHGSSPARSESAQTAPDGDASDEDTVPPPPPPSAPAGSVSAAITSAAFSLAERTTTILRIHHRTRATVADLCAAACVAPDDPMLQQPVPYPELCAAVSGVGSCPSKADVTALLAQTMLWDSPWRRVTLAKAALHAFTVIVLRRLIDAAAEAAARGVAPANVLKSVSAVAVSTLDPRSWMTNDHEFDGDTMALYYDRVLTDIKLAKNQCGEFAFSPFACAAITAFMSRVAAAIAALVAGYGGKTVHPVHLQAAVLTVLPGDLPKHAVAALTRARMDAERDDATSLAAGCAAAKVTFPPQEAERVFRNVLAAKAPGQVPRVTVPSLLSFAAALHYTVEEIVELAMGAVERGAVTLTEDAVLGALRADPDFLLMMPVFFE